MPAAIQKLLKIRDPAKSQAQLQQDHRIIKEYLTMCARKEDWHGVMNASVDVREIVAKLSMFA